MPLVVCVFLSFNTVILAILTLFLFQVEVEDMPKTLFRIHAAATSFACIHTTSSLFITAVAWQAWGQ